MRIGERRGHPKEVAKTKTGRKAIKLRPNVVKTVESKDRCAIEAIVPQTDHESGQS